MNVQKCLGFEREIVLKINKEVCNLSKQFEFESKY